MFSATKFVVAVAIVALFGGFLLSGVLTQPPSDEPLPVGASASATAQAEPTDAATTEPEPTSQVEADDTTTPPDLPPGVDLVTEEVEPGVYRVLSDGVRDLSKRVRDVTVTPEGDVWVELGTQENWDILRLGEPGVSLELGRKSPWTLFTLDGAPVVSAGGVSSWRLFDGEAWAKYEPSSCDKMRSGWPHGGIALDGECWAAGDGNLYRVGDDGAPLVVDPQEIGLGPDRVIASATVAEDGTLWATVYGPSGRGLGFEGLMRYEGSAWEQVPYDQSGESLVDGLDLTGDSPVTVGPDGTVWVIETYWRPPGPVSEFHVRLLRSWDGAAWTTYGPVETAGVSRGSLRGSSSSYLLDDGTVWFRDGLLALDADGFRPLELPGAGDLVYGPDGSAWSFTKGGLYVITPEAVQ